MWRHVIIGSLVALLVSLLPGATWPVATAQSPQRAPITHVNAGPQDVATDTPTPTASPTVTPLPTETATATPTPHTPVPEQLGDVLLATENGYPAYGDINHYSPSGLLEDTFPVGSDVAIIENMCLDRGGYLYTMNKVEGNGGTMSKLDTDGQLLSYPWADLDYVDIFGSCTVDASGNVYVALAPVPETAAQPAPSPSSPVPPTATGGPTSVLGALTKLSPTGAILGQWMPDDGSSGAPVGIALAPDQCTLYYTSAETLSPSDMLPVKRFDVCTGAPLPDFALVSGCSGYRGGLRLRANGEVLVDCGNAIYRLNASGTIIQTYTTPSVGVSSFSPMALGLDPDGASFWTGGSTGYDARSGQQENTVYRIDIASGHVLASFMAPPTWSGALAVIGDYGPALPPATLTPTMTSSATSTSTPSPTATPTATSTPSPTATPTATVPSSPTPSATVSAPSTLPLSVDLDRAVLPSGQDLTVTISTQPNARLTGTVCCIPGPADASWTLSAHADATGHYTWVVHGLTASQLTTASVIVQALPASAGYTAYITGAGSQGSPGAKQQRAFTILPMPVHCPAFQYVVGGWSLRSSSCPVNGRIAGVSVQPPAGLQVQGAMPTLSALPLKHGTPILPITLPTLSMVIGAQPGHVGFLVTAEQLRLSRDGLTIGHANVSLPPDLVASGDCVPLDLTNVHLSPALRITDHATAMRSPLSLSPSNVALDANGFQLSNDGLHVADAHLTLPLAFTGRPFDARGLIIHGDGTVTSEPSSIGRAPLHLPGMALTVSDVEMTADGLAFQGLQAQIPLIPTFFPIPNFTFDGSEIVGGHWDIGAAVPPIPIAGQQITIASTDLALSLSVENNQFGYLFDGSASLDLPFAMTKEDVEPGSGAGLSAHLVLGTITDLHPVTLRTVQLTVTPGIPIPLGDSGLGLTKIGGGLDISRLQNQIVYTFNLSGDIASLPDRGWLLRGSAHGVMATDGNVSISGDVSLLQLAQAHAGICIRLQAGEDHVCDGIGPHGPTDTGVGGYAELTASISPPGQNNRHAYLSGDVYTHLWVVRVADVTPTPGPRPIPSSGLYHGGPRPKPSPKPTPPTHAVIRFSGGATLTGRIDAGYFLSSDLRLFGWSATLNLLPPCDIRMQKATLAVGTFHYHDQYINGLKGSINGSMDCKIRPPNVPPHIPYRANIFYEPPASLTVGNSVNATYQQVGDNESLPGQVGGGIGAASASALGQLGGPVAQPDIVQRVRIKRGQTDTFFTLGWHQGAPALRIVAPDGTVYTPPRTHQFLALAGRNAYWFQTTDPHLLSAQARAATALYVTNPQPGLWQVIAQHVQRGDGIQMAIVGNQPDPVLRVSTPTSRQTVLVRPSAPRVSISGTVSGANPTDTVSLYYTTAPTVAIGGHQQPNYGGTLITDSVRIAGGRWHYRWDTRTATLRRGTYYLYAVLNNGLGPAVETYSTGRIRVVQQARAGAPRHAQYMQSGRRLTVTWLAPLGAVPVSGYIVHIQENARHGLRYSVFVGNTQSLTLPDLTPGLRYTVTVVAYDLSGAPGPAATARLVHPTPVRRHAPKKRHATRKLTPRKHTPVGKAGVAFGRMPASNIQPWWQLGVARDQAIVRLSLRVHGSRAPPLTAHVGKDRSATITRLLRVLAPDEEGASCPINRLANTPYAKLKWTLPGTDREVVVGELTGNEYEFVKGTFYGPLDFSYTGGKDTVLLSLGRVKWVTVAPGQKRRVYVGAIQESQYYNREENKVGRPTGIVSVLTRSNIKQPSASDALRIIDPPGFQTHDPRTGADLSRGHLLGDNLGGSDNTGRNFVTLFQSNTNSPLMSGLEDEVANALRDHDVDTVFYRVTPEYPPFVSHDKPEYVIPRGIDLEAIGIGAKRLLIHEYIPNDPNATTAIQKPLD